MAKKTDKSEPVEVPIEEYEQRVRRLPEPVPMQYVALIGLNHSTTPENPRGKRVERGEEVPAAIVEASPWLLTGNHVRVKKGE